MDTRLWDIAEDKQREERAWVEQQRLARQALAQDEPNTPGRTHRSRSQVLATVLAVASLVVGLVLGLRH